MESMRKALLNAEEQSSWGEAFVHLFWVANWNPHFFHEHFYMKELNTDEVWLFRLGCSADIFSKVNKVSLSLQEKQLTIFVANDKIQAKIEFWRLIFATVSLTVSQYLTFLKKYNQW